MSYPARVGGSGAINGEDLDGAWSPYRRSGQFIYSHMNPYFGSYSDAQNVGALAADTLYFVPIWIPRRGIQVSHVGLYVSTGEAAKNARLGRFNVDLATGYPSSRAVDYGEVSCATSGRKEIEINEFLTRASDQRPFVYLAVAIQGFTTGRVSTNWLLSPLLDTTIGVHASGFPYLGDIRMAHVYGALPANAGSLTFTAGGSGNSPMPTLRIA